MAANVVDTLLHEPWASALKDVVNAQPNMKFFVGDLRPAGALPTDPKHIFRALHAHAPDQWKVVIFGQNPFPRAGSSIGIAFCDGEIKSWADALSPSLRNIIKNALICGGLAEPDHKIGQLVKVLRTRVAPPLGWFKHTIENKVLWLNTTLTYEEDQETAHNRFWKPIIEKIVETLLAAKQQAATVNTATRQGIVFVLWGTAAQKLKDKIVAQAKKLKVTVPIKFVETPSPAVESFNTTRSFTSINDALVELGYDAIDFLPHPSPHLSVTQLDSIDNPAGFATASLAVSSPLKTVKAKAAPERTATSVAGLKKAKSEVKDEVTLPLVSEPSIIAVEETGLANGAGGRAKRTASSSRARTAATARPATTTSSTRVSAAAPTPANSGKRKHEDEEEASDGDDDEEAGGARPSKKAGGPVPAINMQITAEQFAYARLRHGGLVDPLAQPLDVFVHHISLPVVDASLAAFNRLPATSTFNASDLAAMYNNKELISIGINRMNHVIAAKEWPMIQRGTYPLDVGSDADLGAHRLASAIVKRAQNAHTSFVTRDMFAEAKTDKGCAWPPEGGSRWNSWAHLLELTGYVVNINPTEGDEARYALRDEWLLSAPVTQYDMSLNEVHDELMRRFLHAYGPVTIAELRRFFNRRVNNTDKKIPNACLVPQSVLTRLGAEVVSLSVADDANVYYALAVDCTQMQQTPPPRDQFPFKLLGKEDPLLYTTKEWDWVMTSDTKGKIIRPMHNDIPALVMCRGRIVGVWKQRAAKSLNITVEWLEKPHADDEAQIRVVADHLLSHYPDKSGVTIRFENKF